MELEVEVREFVAPAAFTSALVSLFGVRTDTMLGHVDWVDLLHLNIEQNVLTRKLVSVRTREGPARSWRARGGSTLIFCLVCSKRGHRASRILVRSPLSGPDDPQDR